MSESTIRTYIYVCTFLVINLLTTEPNVFFKPKRFISVFTSFCISHLLSGPVEGRSHFCPLERNIEAATEVHLGILTKPQKIISRYTKLCESV